MFGYITPVLNALSDESKARYRSVYCGVCHALRDRHGQAGRISLSNDMTFLALLLSSLYEPEEETGEHTCARHPMQAQPYAMSELSDYAAHMNIAMAYLKCLDDWNDDRSVLALSEAKTLRPGYAAVKKKYPRQCDAIEAALRELSKLEADRRLDPDAAAASFGRMMREIFVYREDRWAEPLREMADALGRFLYLLDAALDLEEDAKRGRYNPFLNLRDDPGNEERFRDILRMHLGECVYWFDRLPLVQDAGLMKNILCVGLWSSFNQKYNSEGPENGSGSV